MFTDFTGYVHFFLLDDLIDENRTVKFYLPFDNFNAPPAFADVDEYLVYKKGVMNFIRQRNERINRYFKNDNRVTETG